MTAFEAILADVQSEQIAASLEYSGDGVSDVCVYGSIEDGSTVFDVFYIVDRRVVDRNDLPGVDTSATRQLALIRYGMNQLDRLVEACTEFSRPVPTELKLHYSVSNRALDSVFEYEPRLSASASLHPNDFVEAWRAEVQTELDAEAE